PRSASFVSLYGPPPPSLSPLSLHDALPISWIAFFLTVYAGLAMVSNAPFYSGKSFALGRSVPFWVMLVVVGGFVFVSADPPLVLDRKSTRLNSSHVKISYAVFCLKKKVRLS